MKDDENEKSDRSYVKKNERCELSIRYRYISVLSIIYILQVFDPVVATLD